MDLVQKKYLKNQIPVADNLGHFSSHVVCAGVFFIFLPYGVKDSFAFFQYGQNIASKLWAAVFALISIDLYKTKEKEKEDKKDETDKKP
jgi:hypothetical protein